MAAQTTGIDDIEVIGLRSGGPMFRATCVHENAGRCGTAHRTHAVFIL